MPSSPPLAQSSSNNFGQTNHSNAPNLHHHPLSFALHYQSALFAILSSLAILFEAAHFAALVQAMRNRRVSRKFNILVLNKSLADSLFCFSFLLFGIWQIAAKRKLNFDNNSFLFLFVDQIGESLLISSFSSYATYSLLRIYGIRWPFRFRKKFMVHHAIRLNLFSWALFFTFILAPLFLHFSSTDFPYSIVHFLKCIMLLALQIIITISLSINVFLIYRNWRFSRAFHNARRASSTIQTDRLQPTPHIPPQISNDNVPFPPSSVPTPQSQLDRTPSIVNRRHQFSLIKSALNLLALCTLHIPLIFMEIQQIVQQKKQRKLASILWTLAIGGVLMRVGADALLGTFCDIEVYKSFLQILHNLLPKCLRPSALSANLSGSSLTVRGVAGGEKFIKNGTISREL